MGSRCFVAAHKAYALRTAEKLRYRELFHCPDTVRYKVE